MIQSQDRGRPSSPAIAGVGILGAIGLWGAIPSPGWAQSQPPIVVEITPYTSELMPVPIPVLPAVSPDVAGDRLDWGTPLPPPASATDPAVTAEVAAPVLEFLPVQPVAPTATPTPLGGTPTAQATVSPKKGVSAYIGSRIPNPTAAQGPTAPPVTRLNSDVRPELNLTGGVEYRWNDRDRVSAEARVGLGMAGLYFGYLHYDDRDREGWGVNVFNQRARSVALDGGATDVDLPGDETAWVHRTGGGIQAYAPAGAVDLSIGATYQAVSVRDDIFSETLESEDERGNDLTFSDDGEDELLTLNLAAQYDTRDRADRPTQGTRLRVGVDQSLPIGQAEIAMTRLSGSATQFIPLAGLGFTRDPDVLVLNLQGGHILGDVPFYESFSLGGVNSVRGYGRGDLATGSSFLQATAEYRFPISELTVFSEAVDLGGTLFVDYGTALGTQDEVRGEPGLERDKPGAGVGVGAGLRFNLDGMVGRLEFGFSDEGEGSFYFVLGERF